MRFHVFPIIVLGVTLASALSCGGSSDAPPTAVNSGQGNNPPPPPPPSPIITVSSDSVVGTALGGSAALVQDVQISAGNATALVSIVVTVTGLATGDDGSWVTTTLNATSAPATLTVRIDPKSLTAGVRTATISVSATNAQPKAIRVQLTVRPHPVLVVDKLTSTVAAALGDSIAPMTVSIKSSSDTIAALSIGDPHCDGGHWLTAALSSNATPATASLNVDPHGLAAGTYACQVVVQSAQSLVDSASQTITVTLTLRQAPKIALDSTSFGRTAFPDADAAAAVVHVSNAGTGTLDHLAVGAIDYGNGASGWVTPTLNQATAPATLSLVLRTRTLPPGLWSARIPVTSSADGVTNSPQMVTVAVTIAAKPFLFRVSPGSFTLTGHVGGPTVSTSVSLFDANGGTTTITRIRTATSACTTGLPGLSYTLFTTNAIPQTGSMNMSPLGTPTSCTITWTIELANGSGGSLTGTFVVLP